MFTGRLFYENEKNCIDVELIDRPHGISIRATTTWDGLGIWTIDSPAKLLNGVYTTPYVFSISNFGIKSEIQSKITLKIVTRSDALLTIKGKWIEQGHGYPFSGELELQK